MITGPTLRFMAPYPQIFYSQNLRVFQLRSLLTWASTGERSPLMD
jgi:hypothetical protein